MKQKYYNTSSIHVGFLGYVKCDENGAMWTKMKDCPCVIYEEKLSETLDNAMEAYDVFSDNHYFFYNSVTNSKKNILEIVNGKCAIGKGFPIKIILDNEKALECELKSVLWNFNILDAMAKKCDDKILSLLKKEMEMIDSVKNIKDRERFIDSISFYAREYIKATIDGDKSSEEKNILNEEDIKNQIKKIYNYLIDYINHKKTKIKKK